MDAEDGLSVAPQPQHRGITPALLSSTAAPLKVHRPLESAVFDFVLAIVVFGVATWILFAELRAG
jgi:hypothetical protein